MKIKPTTLFLVISALLLVGVVAVVETQPPSPQAETAGQEKLVGFQEKQIQTVALQTQLRSLKFQRDKDGKWQMLEPDSIAASDPSMAYLLDLIATGKSDRSFTVPASNQQDYGFHQPLATIELTLDNQETHKLILGSYDFNRSFIYAQVDPPAQATEMKVLLVSPNFENAVNRPLAEWKDSTAAGKQAGSEAKSSPEPASPTPTESPEVKQQEPAAPSPAPSPAAPASPTPEASP